MTLTGSRQEFETQFGSTRLHICFGERVRPACWFSACTPRRDFLKIPNRCRFRAIRKSRSRGRAGRYARGVRYTTGQFAEPAQRDGSLGIVDFVAAVKRADSNSLKSRSFDGACHVVLLLQSRDPVVAPAANVNRRREKILARPDTGIAHAQPVFVRTGDINARDTRAILCKQWRDQTYAFAAARKSRARDGPFVRAGKAAVQRVDGGERHRSAPPAGVVPRRLRTVAGKQHPTFRKSNSAIEVDKVIAILPFEIAGGARDQYRPTFSRIKIRRSGEHGHGIRRHSVAALTRQRFFLRTQRNVSFDG